jgi:hypothetical protein
LLKSCWKALAAFYRRQKRPSPRTLHAVRAQLYFRARRLGRQAHNLPLWSNEEVRIVDKYVSKRHWHRGEFLALHDACYAELQVLWRARPPHPRLPQGRTAEALRVMLYQRAYLHGRPKVAPRWSPVEHQVSRKWAKKWLARRNTFPTLHMEDAARFTLVELYEKGFERTLAACCIELRKQVNEMLGCPYVRRPAKR